MKITLTNIEYSESYKALTVHNQPSELEVEIPDTTMEHEISMVVCKAIADQYSPDLAMGIESAEFSTIRVKRD